jgi:hypothetical protein
MCPLSLVLLAWHVIEEMANTKKVLFGETALGNLLIPSNKKIRHWVTKKQN